MKSTTKRGLENRYAAKTKELPIPLRGTGQAGLQKEIQAHCAGYGLERALPAADPSGHAAGLHAVLRASCGSLHHLSVLRQPGVLLLQRVHQPGHDLPHGQRRHLFQGQRAQIPVPFLKKYPDSHQLWPDPVRLLCILRPGRHHLHMEVCLSALSCGVPGAVQHRGGAHSLRPVRLLPGYPISMGCVHTAAHVHVRHLLHHR